jgi:hypothetical protein
MTRKENNENPLAQIITEETLMKQTKKMKYLITTEFNFIFSIEPAN